MKFLDLFKRQASPYTAKRAPLAAALEPRMLFDGAVAATVADTAVSDSPAAQDPTTDNTDHQASDALTPPAATSDQRQEIVFVDGGISDYQQLVSGLKPGTEVVVLDASKDGLQQIADYLEGRSGIDAIHIFSHGSEGQVHLGTLTLDIGNVGERSTELSAIGDSLTDSGDILIYGCEVGQGATSGQLLLQQIAEHTRADVAASTDATGSSALGGDWSLETSTGAIEAAAPWQEAPTYDHLLATVTLNETWLNNGTDAWSYSDNLANGDIVGTAQSIYLDVNNLFSFPAEFTIASSAGAFNLDSITVRPFNNSAFQFEIYPTGDYGAKVLSQLISNQSGQSIVIATNLLNVTSFTVRFVHTGSSQGLPLDMDFLSFVTSTANAAPITTTSGGATAFTEGSNVTSTPVVVDSGLALSDADSTTFASGKVSITGNFHSGEDVLAFTNNNATTMGNITASYNTGTGVLTLSSAGATATKAQWQAALSSVTYTNTSDAPNTSSRTISFQVNDGTADSNTATKTVSISSANDSPVTTASGGTTVFTEGNNVASTPVTVDSGLTLSDADNTTLASGKVSITGNFQSGQDVLAFTNNPATMGNISAIYNTATGELTLTSAGATATLAQWQAALRSVTYSNSSDTPNTSNRTISFAVNDGTADSNSTTKTVSITSVNDSAIATTSGGTSAFSEGSNSVVVDAGLTLSDLDNSTLASATVSITGAFQPGADVLTFTNDGSNMGNITASYNAGTGVLTLTSSGASATLAQWQAALRSVTYSNSSDAPSTTNRTISFIVNDGQGDSAAASKTVSVAATNDAPQVSAPATINVSEDTATAISGISFSDVDAGSASVTVTLSVASGSLAATSGGGVTVGGTSSVMTLTGSIANINTFISGNNVSFTTAANATSDVTLSITINDNGNTGSGGALTDTQTLTLVVTAVNDAPVNSLPTAQSVDQDSSLVFSTGNGNLISISDVDAGGNSLQVTLTASNGLITLSGISGLSFLVGSGTGDATMTFQGTAADINNALNGLTFSPTAGYSGPANLQIATNDLGASGSGSAQSDTDTLNITVNSLNPRITDVSASTANGSYKVGDTITITTTFNQVVTVDTTNGSPTLLLETGLIDRIAAYVSGSGSNTLTFRYTVQTGDMSADLDYQSTTALSLNGASIRNGSADNASLTLPNMGTAGSLGANSNIVIDGVPATVTSVSVPANGTYVAGQNLDFTVNLSENVTVDTSGGTPRLAITLDTGGTVYASYLSGSGSSALVFRLTLANGQADTNGIVLGSLQLNSGTIRDAAGNDSLTALSSVGSTSGVLVDASTPEVSTISLDSPSPTNASSVTFTVTFSEDVSGVDISDFSLATTGSVNATLQSLVQIDAHTYRITVDTITGLGELGLILNPNNANIVDGAGNTLTSAFTSQTYRIAEPVVTTSPAGDPEFRINPPPAPGLPQTPLLQPQVPGLVTNPSAPPLAFPSLFEVRTVGGDLKPLSTIFLGNGATAPSFIAQVFGSSDSGLGGASGFLGFGGGDGGVFGSSTFSSLFSHDVPGASEMNVFSGSQGKQSDLNQGLRGVFGVPTFGQQLHDLHDNEQRQVRELAQALGQFESRPVQA